MRSLGTSLLLLLCLPGPVSRAQQMARAEEPEVGLTVVSGNEWTNPGGFPWLDLPNGDFEDPLTAGAIIQPGLFRRVEDGSAPSGKACLIGRAAGRNSIHLEVPAREGRPYVMTAWIRSEGTSQGSATSVTDLVYFGKTSPLHLPDTRGTWQRAAFFARAAPGATALHWSLTFPPGEPGIDDLRCREAGEEEFAAAYALWRSQFPARDLSPRPEDGRFLAGFIAKLKDPQRPREPLRIMGIGSSYTNMLGNGECLIQWIREHFPGAPPVLYEKHVGSAVEYDFTRGWMRQHVLGKKPDLVILYSGGKAADLDKMLGDFRQHCTADILVASLHIREQDREITGATVNAPEWDAVRLVALSHGCEWVDNRREWAAYLREHQQPIPWLLKDAVHQNDHGALVINENICRHLVESAQPAYRPEEREHSLWVKEAGPAGVAEGIEVTGEQGLVVRFRGIRIDLIGERRPEGGMWGDGLKQPVLLDGVPLDQVPAFVTTLILPGGGNAKPAKGLAADRSPHQIRLGPAGSLIPQAWTLRMTSDTGDFELLGSVTGYDGRGNNGTDFVSDSGQISVPIALWRRRVEADGRHSNRAGDLFSWQVLRATQSRVNFAGTAGETFSVTLADQLSNRPHVLTVPPFPETMGKVLGFRIHRPPPPPDPIRP